MAKYSYELKKEIVQAYLNGEGGYGYLAKKYGIPSKRRIGEWVAVYQKFGDEGIMQSRKNKEYSFEFKVHVVELYLTSEISYQELAIKEGINNPSLLVRWVKDFRIGGADALRPKKKGRKSTMASSKKILSKENTTVDTSTEYVKQLEAELLTLRIENAYLKELRRLRLEEEALLKEMRELSTASEESSD